MPPDMQSIYKERASRKIPKPQKLILGSYQLRNLQLNANSKPDLHL
jgi:hypothetical protein